MSRHDTRIADASTSGTTANSDAAPRCVVGERETHDPRLPRPLRWLAFVSFTSGLAGVPLMLLNFPFVAMFALIAAAFGLVVFVVAAVTISHARARDQSRLKDVGFNACPRCSYQLEGLPDTGTCPECGLAYTRVTLH